MICERCGKHITWAALDELCSAISESTRRFFSITMPAMGGINLLGHIWRHETATERAAGKEQG
jgi:hypothetical protein